MNSTKIQKEAVSKANTTHGMSGTSFYKVFFSIKARCSNPNEKCFLYYGGRGIKCLWNSFEEFRDDMYASYANHVKEFGQNNTQIDRKNVDGNYCKENCRWTTRLEQANNKRSNYRMDIPAGTYTVSELARKFGMKPMTFYNTVARLKKRTHKNSSTFLPRS